MPSAWLRVRRAFFKDWPWALLTLWATAMHRWWVALVGGLMTLVCHVTSTREQPPTYGLEHRFAIGSRSFLDSLIGVTGAPLLDGNHARILNNGDEFYPAMLQAIEEARHSVTMEAYIFWAGRIGRAFAAVLAARAKKGVQVKLLLDAVGSATIGEEILQILERGGCQLAWFNPIRWYTVDRFNYRTHRKSLVIDGRVGYTGGAGIADQWAGRAQDREHWRDLQIEIRGPGVLPLQAGWAENWRQTTGELVTGPEFFPRIPATGPTSLQLVLSSPATGSSTVRLMYALALISARRSIRIANPYFIPDPTAMDLLRDAAARGVDVQVMVAGAPNDSQLARLNAIRLYGALLEARVRIFEYERTLLHLKTMVVDGEWATLGTTNFSRRSFSLNEESNVCLADRSLVEELVETFDADLDGCREVAYQEWRRRGLWQRAAEVAASLLQDQI